MTTERNHRSPMRRGASAHHRHRHRLPGRHPRDLHGRPRLRGARRRHRPSEDRRLPRARCRSSSPACPRCSPKALDTGRISVHHRLRRGRGSSATSTSSASARPQADGLARRGPHLRGARVRRDLATRITSEGAWSSASRRCRSAPPPGSPADRPGRRPPAGSEVELAWNPEFLREGFAVEDTLHPDRLVFGVASAWAERAARGRVRPDPRRRRTRGGHRPADRRAGQGRRELVPGHQDLLHQRDGGGLRGDRRRRADLLAKALAYDDRIGGRFLKPGLGFGGGCLPKDIRAFMHRAEELGVGQAVAFLREVDAINNRRRQRTVDLVRELAGGELDGVRVAAWARRSSPTPTTSATRPALDVARMLHQEGAEVVRSTTRRRTRTPAVPTPTSTTPTRMAEAARRRGCRRAADRVGPVPPSGPRTLGALVSTAVSSTDGTHSMPTRTAPPGGTIVPSGVLWRPRRYVTRHSPRGSRWADFVVWVTAPAANPGARGHPAVHCLT